MKDKIFRSLHLSDLHISTSDQFNASVVHKAFIERLKMDKELGLHPEIVAITGDIALIGIQAEYKSTKVFLDELLDCLGLPQERLFVVPGSHDVNCQKFRKSEDIPRYLPTKGFEASFRQPIEIEQVYINMRGNIHGNLYDCKRSDKIRAPIDPDQLSLLDIKGAFDVLNQRDIRDMVILGIEPAKMFYNICIPHQIMFANILTLTLHTALL